jgi:tetratricopeptide (TPR) repeat protein
VDTVLEQCSKTELIALIKKMLRRQPDFELLLPTIGKQRMFVDPDVYRRQVKTAFRHGGYEWGAEDSIADELSSIRESADDYLEQQDYANAVAIYEVIITETLEELGEYRDEEGELSSFIAECVDALDRLLDNLQNDKALREQVLHILFAAYSYDIEAGGIGVAEEVPDILLKHATAGERQTIVGWIQDALAKKKVEYDGIGWRHEQYGSFLLELQADRLDDETFLRICRETGRTHDLVDRLLALGRIDEAIQATGQASDYDLLGLANLFVEHGHSSLAERMILERSKKSSDTRLLEWLKQHYLARNDWATASGVAEQLFRISPGLTGYQEIRQFTKQLGHWEAKRQELLAFLNKSQNTYVLVKIALDEGDIDKALEMVKTKPEGTYGYAHGYFYSHSSIAIEVANAAEESRPRAAIEIYQKQAERLIDMRGREAYQQACGYLTKVRTLYQKLGEYDTWMSYISALRDRTRTLRALKEELTAAGL